MTNRWCRFLETAPPVYQFTVWNASYNYIPTLPFKSSRILEKESQIICCMDCENNEIAEVKWCNREEGKYRQIIRLKTPWIQTQICLGTRNVFYGCSIVVHTLSYHNHIQSKFLNNFLCFFLVDKLIYCAFLTLEFVVVESVITMCAQTEIMWGTIWPYIYWIKMYTKGQMRG